MTTHRLMSARSLNIARHCVAALMGGYVFCWGFIALGTAGFFTLGMSFHDAEALSYILAFLIYPTVFLWAFATRKLARVSIILVGGGALMVVMVSLQQWLVVN